MGPLSLRLTAILRLTVDYATDVQRKVRILYVPRRLRSSSPYKQSVLFVVNVKNLNNVSVFPAPAWVNSWT